MCPFGSRRPVRVDAVEKSRAIVGFAIGGRFRPIPGRALPDRRTPEPTCRASYAIDALSARGGFDGLTLSPCYEAMSLQIGLAGRDRFLIPFKTNARHVRNVK